MIISSPSHVVKWRACALPSFPSRIPSRDRASRHSRVLEGRERSTPCRGWTTKGGQQKQKVSSSCLKCRVNDSFRCIYPHTKLDGGAYVYIYNCLHHRPLPRRLSYMLYALYLHSPISCSSNAFSSSLHLRVIISFAFTCPSGVARRKSFGLVRTPKGGRGESLYYYAKSRSGRMVGSLARNS